jgi:glutathione synthase
MRFVFVMDPMMGVLPDKDTSFAFQRAAQSKGHECYHCLLPDLRVEDGRVVARARTVKVTDLAPYFAHGEKDELNLDQVDAIFIRKDPPFDSAYLYATLMLELVRDKTIIVNDPRGLRDANEKLYTLHFAKHMPKTIVTSQEDRIMAFVDSVGGVGVIKPLDGAGGSNVLKLEKSDSNARAIIEILTKNGRELAMVQEYLPAVKKGDKRVLLLDGEVLGGILRVPRADDLRSNIHVGGTVQPCDVTPQERAIVSDIAPRLKKDGLIFVGLDMIGGRLTEVNVTSPTGIQELSRHIQRDVAEDVIAWTERAVAARAKS